MNFSMKGMPAFVEKEMKKLEEMLIPLMKKASKYSFWSLPLITLSIVNLFFLLFVVDGQHSFGALLFYGILGAVGLALSKEAKFQRKELHKVSSEYIVKRIRNSDIVAEHVKSKYIQLVQEQPVMLINHFVQFLEEENRTNRNYWQMNT